MAHPHSNLVELIDNIEIDIGSLASKTALSVAGNIDSSRENGFRTLKQEGNVTPDGTALTAPTGGPLIVGFCDDELTVTEIKEKIEANPQSSTSVTENEDAARVLFILGYCNLSDLNMRTNFQFTKRFKWSYPEGAGINYWVYNSDINTAIAATGQLKIFCKHIGVWLRD